MVIQPTTHIWLNLHKEYFYRYFTFSNQFYRAGKEKKKVNLKALEMLNYFSE